MEKCCKIANLYVATLRSIYLIEQHCHWTTRGTGFYGDHLLFQRLYESAIENGDLAAEKFIGLFEDEALDYSMQCELIHKICSKYADLKDEPLKQALAIEQDFLALSKETFDYLEKDDKLSLGLNDTISLIANKREESCYLLKQALKGTQ